MKEIYYKSTRGEQHLVSAAEAILTGLAPDGGLFVPTYIPRLEQGLEKLVGLPYQELALQIIKPFLPDFSVEELRDCLARAYDEKFDTPQIAPVVKHSGLYFLELFHGPTLAFKDLALAILPHLLKVAVSKLKINKEVVILTATSGDTGKAALEGFAGVEGTKIIVFFPEHGVSEIQKRQMVTQKGENTYVIGIEGNFDDAQNGVKKIFADPLLRARMASQGLVFSSANSINIGRLVPQIAYYFHAYQVLCARGELEVGEEINFVVPTGNFGNILAGYYAKKMGLPVKKLICASNDNKVLYDFIRTGVYDRRRDFVTTISPSMDILISSNLERLLYLLCSEDTNWVKQLMEELSVRGVYVVPPEVLHALQVDFAGGYASEAATRAAIKEVFRTSAYLLDPHTAVAYAVYQDYLQKTGDKQKTVILSTASPYKFARDVFCSINDDCQEKDDFRLIKELYKLTGLKIPSVIEALEYSPIRHQTVCRIEEMQNVVEKILSL